MNRNATDDAARRAATLDAAARFNVLAGTPVTVGDDPDGVRVVALVRAGEGFAICCPACAAALRKADPAEVVDVVPAGDVYSDSVCDCCGMPATTFPTVPDGAGLERVQREFLQDRAAYVVAGVRTVVSDVAVLCWLDPDVTAGTLAVAKRAMREEGTEWSVWPVAAGWAVMQRGWDHVIVADVMDAGRYIAACARGMGHALAWTDANRVTTHAPYCLECSALHIARAVAFESHGGGGEFTPDNCPDRFTGDVLCDRCREVITEHACVSCGDGLRTHAYVVQNSDRDAVEARYVALCADCADSAGRFTGPGTLTNVGAAALFSGDHLEGLNRSRVWQLERLSRRDGNPRNPEPLRLDDVAGDDPLYLMIAGLRSW